MSMQSNRIAPSFSLPVAPVIPDELSRGLLAEPKTLPSKYFYDERGSRLFERICELEEYYVTRTELAILRERAPEIAGQLGRRVALFELGSGAGVKARLLLRELADPAAYVPIDISREILLRATEELRAEFPALEVHPVCADFTRPLEIPEPYLRRVGNRVAFFPGSTIGNFDPLQARLLLGRIATFLGPFGMLLIGVDLLKDRQVLERAYNDREGVTARFNLNLLARLNREYGADFDLGGFRHEARFDPDHRRIEMHLISLREQTVRLGEHRFRFREGESIHTENSYKYELKQFHHIASQAGYSPVRSWTDSRNYFGITLLAVDDHRFRFPADPVAD